MIFFLLICSLQNAFELRLELGVTLLRITRVHQADGCLVSVASVKRPTATDPVAHLDRAILLLRPFVLHPDSTLVVLTASVSGCTNTSHRSQSVRVKL